MTITPPISLFIGDDWTVLVPVTDAKGVPVNLSNYTVTGNFYNNGVAQALTVANGGITITNAAGGIISLFVAAATTATVPSQLATANTFPTRFTVSLTNVSSLKVTPGVIYILPEDPKTI